MSIELVLRGERQHHIEVCDVLAGLRKIPDNSIQCCVTSPPYYGLRDYGLEPSIWGGEESCDHQWGDTVPGSNRGGSGTPTDKNGRGENYGRDAARGSFCQKCSAWRGCFGLEPTPSLYVAHSVLIFREVRRVLRDDGTFWLNIGDSYASGGGTPRPGAGKVGGRGANRNGCPVPADCKPKDLIGIPWMVAFALRDDGWWLRSEIIWCLSGGNWVYARTQKGDMPMMVRDMARLDPATVKLWNGTKWTQLLGMNKSARTGEEIEFTLRSGERISCTPSHKFPTSRGLLEAKDIAIGDSLVRVTLPEPDQPRDCVLDEDAGWLAGLYVAEGSMSGDTIQLAGHVNESERWEKCQRIARKFGGSAARFVDGNNASICLYGKVLVAIIAELVSGRTAKDKCFAPPVWKYSNRFLAAMMNGYLDGDSQDDEENRRYRLGFTRNYNLERDIRIACARLNWTLTLNLSVTKFDGQYWQTFKGEVRKARSGHWNEKSREEVLSISRSRCRYVYDLGVEDEPHLFALSSGILTHNSKPNAMPDSCQDRPTKSHEQIFLLTKSATYYYDHVAIFEPFADERQGRDGSKQPRVRGYGGHPGGYVKPNGIDPSANGGKNKRSVWNIPVGGYREAHFATFPLAIPETCLKAGTSLKGCCAKCGAPIERVTESERTPTRPGDGSKIKTVGPNSRMRKNRDPAHAEDRNRDDQWDSSVVGNRDPERHVTETKTVGWQPTCKCNANVERCVCLDPFNGAATTGLVAVKGLNLRYIGLEKNPEYAEMSERRINAGFSEIVRQPEATAGQLALFGDE